MKNIRLLALSICFLSGCSKTYENITHDNQLHQQEQQSNQEADQNYQLQQQVRNYKLYLQSIFVTDQSIWVYAVGWQPSSSSALSPYEQAKSVCSDINYQLPTPDQLQEFMTEVVAKSSHADVSSLKAQDIYTTTAPTGLFPDFLLCRTSR